MLQNILFGLGAAAITWLLVRAFLVFVRKVSFEQYWQKELKTTPLAQSYRLVAFGDSISQGVGASRPQNSLVGRAAAYISFTLDRPVYVANYSRSGATAHDVLTDQIPQADIQSADIILLEVGVNDSYRRTVEQFSNDMSDIFDQLPLEKTIIADIPFAKLRQPYQDAISKLLAERSAHSAYPSKVFIDLFASLAVTAGDFWHPNDKGYKLWFDMFRPGIDVVLGGKR